MSIEHIKELFKFSWAQAFSDTNGKSSASTLAYFIVTIAGCVGFIKSIFIKDGNLTMWSVTVISIGIAAFTGQKIVNGKVQPIDMTPIKDIPELSKESTTIAQVTTITEESSKPSP